NADRAAMAHLARPEAGAAHHVVLRARNPLRGAELIDGEGVVRAQYAVGMGGHGVHLGVRWTPLYAHIRRSVARQIAPGAPGRALARYSLGRRALSFASSALARCTERGDTERGGAISPLCRSRLVISWASCEFVSDLSSNSGSSRMIAFWNLL